MASSPRPNQSRENPIGLGGLALHDWHLNADEHGEAADIHARDELLAARGAFVMGRNMFGPIRGEWDEDWRGWWGDEPPDHAPDFVLTHHARDAIQMEGGTTFHFITSGFDAALEQAKAAALTHRRLGGSDPRHRNPERRAAHVVQAAVVKEGD